MYRYSKTNKKCSGSCVINEKDEFIRSTHNHSAYNRLEIEIRSFATNIKERSLSEDITPSAIYNDERRKLIERTQSESS